MTNWKLAYLPLLGLGMMAVASAAPSLPIAQPAAVVSPVAVATAVPVAQGSIGPVIAAVDRAAVDRVKSRLDQRRVTEELISELASQRATSPEAARLETLLRLLLDRDRIQADPNLDQAIADLERPRATSRNRSLRDLEAEVLDRAAHFTAMMGRGQYDSEDAARLLNIAKYASQLRDDLRDPSGSLSGDNATKATKMLATAYGVAAIAHGSLDGDGRLIMDGVRDLAGQSDVLGKTGVGTILDIPGELTAAQLTVTRKALDQASTTLDDIGAALKDDPQALSRAIAGSKKLDGMLSGAAYGGAMKDALISRLTDKVPGLRTILNWWPDAPEDATATTAPTGPKLVPATLDPKSYKDAQGRTALFRHGDKAFADRVGGYAMGSPAPSAIAREPFEATGAPDDAAVSLGCGGNVVLEFVDNRLIDVPGPDLYVFEVGPDVESTLVEISAEGGNWITIGPIAGSTSAIDIGGKASPGIGYRYVRLTDRMSACNSGTYAGADINAVGAIGSALAPAKK